MRFFAAEFGDLVPGYSRVTSICNAFRIAAQALGAFYRQLRARMGEPKAITAAAHKLARMFYRLWTTRQIYCDPGMDYYEQQFRERMIHNLKKKAQSMGFDLVTQPEVTEGVS